MLHLRHCNTKMQGEKLIVENTLQKIHGLPYFLSVTLDFHLCQVKGNLLDQADDRTNGTRTHAKTIQ